MAGHVMKVLLTSRIFDYSSLLDDSKEVPTVGVIPTQLGKNACISMRMDSLSGFINFIPERVTNSSGSILKTIK